MKTKLFILGLFLTQLVTAQDNLRFLAYIDTYKEIAIQEMERAGIPASIKLAQGLLESSAGRSKLATEANNHFGIKCGGSWRGGTYYHNDDDYNDKGELIPSCFRMYRDATQSYRAHSEFLRNPSKAFRYGRLFRLKVKDYKRWARGLKDAGYATAENYDEKLIDLIERYELYKYDRMSVEEAAEEEWIVVDEEVRERPKPLKEFEVLETNDVKYVVSTSEEDLAAIAERTAISLKYLQKYNEGLTDGTISPGTRVFIQPKRNTYRGREMWHKVQKGETMYSISQLYGLKLERLYERNRMEEEMEPAVGEQIKLRGRKAKKTPKLFVEEVAAVAETLAAPEVLELEEPASEEPTEEEPVVEKPIAEEPAPEKPFAKALEILRVRQEATAEVPMAEDKAHYQENAEPQEPVEPSLEEVPVVDTTNVIPSVPTEVALEEEAAAMEKPVIVEEAGQDESLYHKVSRGETLWGIAKRYSTTVDSVRKLNQLGNDSIRTGMRLRVR